MSMSRNPSGWKEITLGEKEMFGRCFQRGRVQVSELTFTNLFVRRKHYGFRYAMIGDVLVVAAWDAENPFGMIAPAREGSGWNRILEYQGFGVRNCSLTR